MRAGDVTVVEVRIPLLSPRRIQPFLAAVRTGQSSAGSGSQSFVFKPGNSRDPVLETARADAGGTRPVQNGRGPKIRLSALSAERRFQRSQLSALPRAAHAAQGRRLGHAAVFALAHCDADAGGIGKDALIPGPRFSYAGIAARRVMS